MHRTLGLLCVGVQKSLGHAWIMGGAGAAALRERGRGPKSITVSDTLNQPRFAVAGGIGIDVDSGQLDEPTSLALEGGRTIDTNPGGAIYQWSASMVQRF